MREINDTPCLTGFGCEFCRDYHMNVTVEDWGLIAEVKNDAAADRAMKSLHEKSRKIIEELST